MTIDPLENPIYRDIPCNYYIPYRGENDWVIPAGRAARGKAATQAEIAEWTKGPKISPVSVVRTDTGGRINIRIRSANGPYKHRPHILGLDVDRARWLMDMIQAALDEIDQYGPGGGGRNSQK